MAQHGERKRVPQRDRSLISARWSMVALVLAARTASADPNDYVFMPAVDYGERELDFKYGVAGKKDEPTAQAASFGFGYGLKEWWFTEFYLKGTREGSRSTFDARAPTPAQFRRNRPRQRPI